MKADVYRFHAADGTLLYVGMTSRAMKRWQDHSEQKTWWEDVAYVRVEHYPTREDAAVAEASAIMNENPQHNGYRLETHRRHPRLGVYRRWGEGSLFLAARGTWEASIRHNGKRYRFFGGHGEKGRAKADALLQAFRQRHGITSIAEDAA